MTALPATLANMREYSDQGVIAWSPETGEECSANPSDYFWLPEDEPLVDENDEPMILAYRQSSVVVIGDDS